MVSVTVARTEFAASNTRHVIDDGNTPEYEISFSTILFVLAAEVHHVTADGKAVPVVSLYAPVANPSAGPLSMK